MEITIDIPVIFPDMAITFALVAQPDGIFKGRNCQSPTANSEEGINECFAGNQFLKQILE
jgi:hypothetical protein